MRDRGLTAARAALRHPLLSGVLTIALLLAAVVISYSAQNGLPFVPTYDIKVDIPDAAQLTKNSDVRIGGVRVGQVLAIEAMPPVHGQPPFARLSLALDESVQPLPADTLVRMRLGSLLGGKYIELDPGHSRQTIPGGGHVGLSQARSLVELDDAFRLFDRPTARTVQSAIAGLSNGVAGRGTSINQSISAVSELLPPLDGVLGALGDPGTRLGRLIASTAALSSTLAPVSRQFADLFGVGARTLTAMDPPDGSLARTVDALPATETTGTRSLRHLTPVLAEANALVRELRPATPLLVPATTSLDDIVRLALAPVRRIPAAAVPLEGTLSAGNAFASDPAPSNALRVLGTNDLGSFGGSLFLGLGAVLRTVAPAQLYCNAASAWVRNLSSTFSEGDASGTWIRMEPVTNNGQSLQSAAPAPDLHYNPYPNENASECEAGNEPYVPGQQIGNPPGLQGKTTTGGARAAGAGR